MRADAFLDQGNIDGERVWMRIMQAIEELRRERPKFGEAMHWIGSMTAATRRTKAIVTGGTGSDDIL